MNCGGFNARTGRWVAQVKPWRAGRKSSVIDTRSEIASKCRGAYFKERKRFFLFLVFFSSFCQTSIVAYHWCWMLIRNRVSHGHDKIKVWHFMLFTELKWLQWRKIEQMIHNLRERAGQQIFLVGQHSVADCQRQIQRFIGMTKEKQDGRMVGAAQ